jgi:hypothetical protein
MDGWRHQEYDIHWIGEALFVHNLAYRQAVILVHGMPVIRHLNFMAHFGTIGIKAMQKKFACSNPPGIEVTHLGLDSVARLAPVLSPRI